MSMHLSGSPSSPSPLPANGRAGRAALQDRYADLERLKRTLFDDAPIPMLLEDWSGIKRMLDEVLASGVDDLDAYLKAHPEFIARAQQHHLFLDANRATVALFGASDREQFLLAMKNLLPKSPTADSAILRAFASGARMAQGEKSVLTLDGRRLTILWQVDLSSSTPDHLLFTAIDITQRKATEEALLTAQAELTHTTRAALLGEMAASIAHEVNQPLAAVGIYAESALRWLDKPDPNLARARQGLERIARSAQHAGNVVQRIKGFVRREVPEFRRLDVDEVLSDTELLVHRQASSQGVTLEFDASPDLPKVAAVKVQVQQVLINLIINAIHATAEHGVADPSVRVLVRAGQAEDVIVEVRDNGPGIPADDLERIFSPFFSTRAEGLGLGLALSRSIVEAHGGRIRASNHGTGASFVFTLKVFRDDA